MEIVMRNNPQFWGKAAAGIFFICEEDQTCFLMHRSEYVEQPGTCGIPGGSVQGEGFFDSNTGYSRPTNEAFWAGAKQETIEECGSLPRFNESKALVEYVDFTSGSFIYRNFVVNLSLSEKQEWTSKIQLNWENDDFAWFNMSDLEGADDLHFGVIYLITNSEQLEIEL